jgi:uncharacterized lipoprotein
MTPQVASFMRVSAVLIAAILGSVVLAGCKSPLKACSETNEDYAGAQEMPPLQAPPGLEAPDTRNALRVPPLNTPERTRGKDEPCLSAPPPYATPKAAEPQKPSGSN